MSSAIANIPPARSVFGGPPRLVARPVGTLRPNEAAIPHVVFFLFGLGVFLSVRLVGYVTLAELMAGGVAIMLFAQGRMKNFGREMTWLLVTGGVWAVSAIGTDLYRSVEPALMVRGTGRLFVFILMLVDFYAMIRARPSGLNWLLGGMCVSSVINIFAFRTGEAEFQVMTGESMQSSWERNYAMVTLMAALWLAAWLFERKPLIAAALVAGLGCVNILEGSRNMGGTLLVAAMAAGSFRMMAGITGGQQRMRDGWFALKSGLVIALIVGAVYGGYKFSATQGALGETARVKYQSQASGRFGVLLTSRIDFVAGLLAVQESPIIGYGSWAHDDAGFLQQAYELAEIPFNMSGSMYEFYDRIPTHSAILEAWVEHGLLAMSFWLCALVILARAYFKGAMMDRRWGLLAGFVIAWIGWNILFSPFGGRGIYAVAIAFLALYCEAAVRRKAST